MNVSQLKPSVRLVISWMVVAFAILSGDLSQLYANILYFPQIAYGGGYNTYFTIMNTGTTTVSSQLILYSPLGVQLLNLPMTLPPGGSSRINFVSNGSAVNSGWATFDGGSGTVEGVATFDFRANGLLQATAGVLGSNAASAFIIPVEVTPTSSTGIAVANVNSTSGVNVLLRLIREDGSQFASWNDPLLNPLGARRQSAKFVHEFFPQVAGTTFRGSLIVETVPGSPASPLAVTALVVKEGLLSALPAIASTGTGNSGGSGGTGLASVVFTFSLSGNSNLQFQGRTFTTAGADPFVEFTGLTPGTYEMTGTLGGFGAALIAFANGGGLLGIGGVLPGSLRSLSGPPSSGTIVSACNLTYVNPSSSSQAFRFQFTVTSSTTAACQTGY